MTGFGAAENDGFKVEMRSLNHRYIDISVKLPSILVEHEIPVRNMIKERFARGKFDVIISFTDKRQLKVRIDKEMARGIYNAFQDLQRELSIQGSLNIDFFSGYRELLLTEESQYRAGALYDAVREAVLRVEEMRKNEGLILAKEMLCCVEKLAKICSEIEALSKDMTYNYKEMLLKRLNELVCNLTPNLIFDETRLVQEVALMVQKSDIVEELARFRSHLQQFDSFLTGGDVIGRRLDFLLQEMNREANTIASKVDDVRIINLAIEIKNEIEKLREQAQNIQ
jgi:uncharacterized protein (TIGR00255 family)